MLDYTNKSYGRGGEVETLYRLFEAGRNISMHGPRRLGKTFVLDRIVDAAPQKGWTAVKAELAGCTESRAVFRELCSRIGTTRSGGARAVSWLRQRLGQFLEPRTDSGGSWYQPFVALDHEAYLERLVHAMHDDVDTRWVLLIDELPILLKAMHDKGPAGIANARDFMNMLIRLHQQYPKVRWMITGSIGIEPLAQEGNYMGVLAKFMNFELMQLTYDQAKDFVKDLGVNGQLLNRSEITDYEASAVVDSVGWRAAYYLDALAQKLDGDPQQTEVGAKAAVEAAVARLIDIKEMTTFGVWAEHIKKHYDIDEKKLSFGSLKVVCRDSAGASMDEIKAELAISGIDTQLLRQVMIRLASDGYISVDDWSKSSPQVIFLNPLLRRWWGIASP